MSRFAIRHLAVAVTAIVVFGSAWGVCQAVPPGVETHVRPQINGDERTRQPDLWAVDVYYKSMRMIWVDVPDKKTGKVKRELIWYLPYRIVNREVAGLPAAKGPDGGRPKLLPEFELVTNDNDGLRVYYDEVIPAAQEAINRREGRKYKNSVEIVGSIPEVTAADSKLENTIYGVAMWRGVHPHTDFFTVFMTGFSNGYTKQAGDRVDRRTIMQKYERPGDDVEEVEREIKQAGKPGWIYRPSDDKPDAKNKA